ncbi:unnamed protein product [Effrenium voratum]|uniref:Uncharacterized protein n=1 Tax=Effrenium voratum TaxID=2562239 RepID=A0AA36HLX8_9DINO|nr:unnamed protein product [Effrenium voratum]
MSKTNPTPSTSVTTLSPSFSFISRSVSKKSWSSVKSAREAREGRPQDPAQMHEKRLCEFGLVLAKEPKAFQRMVAAERARQQQQEEEVDDVDEDFAQAMNSIHRSAGCFLGRPAPAANHECKRQMVCL